MDCLLFLVPAAKSLNPRPQGQGVTIWLGLRTRVRFRVPPPYTRARIVSGPFFLLEIPAPRGVPANGLADAVAPLGLQIGVFPAISAPESSLVSVWLAGRRSLGQPKSSTYAPRFAINRARRSSIEPRHDLALHYPVHRQRVALEPQQAHAPGLLPGVDRLHDGRLQQGEAQ